MLASLCQRRDRMILPVEGEWPMVFDFAEADRLGAQIKRRFDGWAGAITDEDRVRLKEKFGVDPTTHEIFRAPIVPWESTYEIGGVTFVEIGGDEVIMFSLRHDPLPD
jgi:hypothetical protein